MPSNAAGFIVVIALFGSLNLSVDAIRCHQCNSHLDEDCIALKLSTPPAGRDNQYLKDCEGEGGVGEHFCRKTVTLIEFSGEHRIIRGCGWDRSDLPKNNKSCLTSDMQGIQQTFCACFNDGCNTAPISLNPKNFVIYGVTILAILSPIILQGSG